MQPVTPVRAHAPQPHAQRLPGPAWVPVTRTHLTLADQLTHKSEPPAARGQPQPGQVGVVLVAAQVDPGCGEIAAERPQALAGDLGRRGLRVEDAFRADVTGCGQRPQPGRRHRRGGAQERLNVGGQDQPVLGHEGQQLLVPVGQA